MKLWTIQHEEAYHEFERTGVLRANNDYLFCEDDFRYAYDWIAQQMVEKVGAPPDAEIKYPIWAWYKWEGKRKRRDLRCSGYGNRGTPMVQIEFEASDNTVLLSDFDDWHLVMAYHYIPDSEEDYDRFYKEHEPESRLPWGMGQDNTDPRIQPMLADIRSSWWKVFDLGYNGWCSSKPGREYIQATLWQITRDQVRKVEHFKAK